MALLKRTNISMYLLLLLPLVGSAGRIDKAYQALASYDYHGAKDMFYKELKKRPVAASYGLSVLYSRKFSPFSDMDSALAAIDRAHAGYQLLDVQTKLKWYQNWGLDSNAISCQRQFVATLFFEQAQWEDTEQAYDRFQAMFPDAWQVLEAVSRRDQLAYHQAQEENSSASWSSFLEKYPGSALATLAEANLEKAVFSEQTHTRDLESFIRFVKEHPESPYLRRAMDSVYVLSTMEDTPEELHAFITRHPSNPNVENAWRRILDHYLVKFEVTSIDRFETDYPEHPIVGYASLWRDAIRKPLFPMDRDGRWGFMDATGRWAVTPRFDWVDAVQEGVAAAGIGDSTLFINALNEVVVGGVWEDYVSFHKGHGVIASQEGYALVNRSGRVVVEEDFEDLYMLTPDIYAFEIDGLLGLGSVKDGELRSASNEDVDYLGDSLMIGAKEGRRFLVTLPDFKVLYRTPGELNSISTAILLEDMDTLLRLVDLQGRVLGEYDSIMPWRNGQAMVWRNDSMGVVDTLGSLVWELGNRTAVRGDAVVEGVYRSEYRGKLAYRDMKGQLVLRTQFNSGGEWGEVIPFQKGDKWGFMDRKGNTLVKASYDWLGPDSDGFRVVSLNGYQGVVDDKGEVFVSPEYLQVSRWRSGFWLVRTAEGYQLLDAKGEPILPEFVSDIEEYQGSWLRIGKGKSVRYYDLASGSFLNVG